MRPPLRAAGRARRGFELPADAPVRGSLRVADQQKVEILRALARDAQLIVMDEPTAALTLDEAERLFDDRARQLRERGTTIVYVSHFLDEVLALADTVTVLRDGRLVRHRAGRRRDARALVAAMLGRTLELTFPPKRPPAPRRPGRPVACDGPRAGGACSDVSLRGPRRARSSASPG